MLSEQKFCRAVQLGFQRMDTARKARYRMLAQYVGPMFAKDKMGGGLDEKKAAPVNLMYNAVTTLVPNLVYNDPRLTVSTEILNYRPYSRALELAANHTLKKMKLRRTLRKVITDALFGVGIIKTGIAASGQTLDLDGKVTSIGEVYADRVDLDDFVFDPMARDQSEWGFVGNRFRIAKAALLEGGEYDPAQIERLCSRYKEGGYRDEASNLSGDGKVVEQYQEVEEFVDLVEVFIPKEQAIVTIPYGDYGGGSDKFLRVVPYEGPETGPYHLLGFAWVPDNVLPVPPATLWYYLHILGNRIARKLARQAERSKRMLAYTPAGIEDARQLVDGDDGESVEVEDINQVKEINLGGTTPEMYEYMTWVETQFSKQAGNIDLLSGTESDAPTATQSQMLQSNANVRVSDMQEQVYTFTGEVSEEVCRFIHTDPLIDLTLARRDPSGSAQQVRYTPEMREGDFFDYTFKVTPYSMARQDPNIQLKRLMEFLSQGIPALAQASQLLGPAFKIENAIALVGRKMNIDELDDLIDSPLLLQQMMMQQQQGPPPDGKLGPGGAGAAPAPGGAPLGGIRPQQPNPNGTGPVGGVMPAQEQNAAAQETAGELQQTY